MPIALLVVQAIYTTATLMSVVLSIVLWQKRDNRPARTLFVATVFAGIWAIGLLLQTTTGRSWGAVVNRGMFIAISIVPAAGLVFALEFTGRENLVTRRTLGLLAVHPLFVTIFVLFDPGGLFFGPYVESTNAVGYEHDVGTAFWIHIAYSYLLVAGTAVILLEFLFRAEQTLYRMQALLLVAGIVVPLPMNGVFLFEIVNFDTTVLGFVSTFTLWTIAIVRYRLTDLRPIARDKIVDTVRDGVFVVDTEDRIIDNNPAARRVEWLDYEGSLVGDDFTELFQGTSELERRYTEMTASLDTSEQTLSYENRYIHFRVSPIMDARNRHVGWVILAQDITDRQNRQEELALLKDLQSRFLRHNLRNELNIVQTYTELLVDEDDPEQVENAQAVMDATERLLEWGDEAKAIDQLLETNDRVTREITGEIEEIVERVQAEFPDVSFEVTLPAEATVVCVPQAPRAIESVIDNAARYNDSENPRIEVVVTTETDQVQIRVTDNGPGLEFTEVETIRNREETALNHSSGFGLWLVDWVIEKSNGDLSFETDNGTIVELCFETPGAKKSGSTDER